MNKIYDVGTHVAFKTPNHSWVLGSVSSYDIKSKEYSCTCQEPEPMRVDKIKNGLESIWAPRLEYLEEDVNDLLQLTELHEASLLFCLKRRYLRDIVYTNIGPIVVALNPFNFGIPWYMDAKMPDYLEEGVMIEQNLPHSWAVAHNTYWEMRENKINQTILVSGESGAGKTEAAKIVVKYLGALSTLNGTEEQQEKCALVNKKVLAASPILESLGNAKTVRNDNSSRFGKFAKIQFDKEGFLIGAFTIKYLLEKSRIVTAAYEERVYHSFYQLALGDDAKHYHLRNPKVYRVLSAGDCLSIDGVDDAVDFLQTKQAMCEIGITEEEQKAIWRVVAGIMYFQNLEFTEAEEKAGKVAYIDPICAGVVTKTCELWGMPQAEIEKELLSSTISARGEQTVRPHTKAQAQDIRDSISKSMYDWLFDWLVNKINTTTDASSTCAYWIGLLDIFGFEDFKKNSFEQLCINLANETLQNHYNFYIFTEDMRECKEEGIDTTMVQFVDNKGCIELLTGKFGIFSLLDEECKVNGTEKNFIQKLNGNFQPTKQKEGNPYFAAATGKTMETTFKIKHYAAEVSYSVEGCMDKNRDTLKDAMKLVLSKSDTPLISGLVPSVADESSRPSVKMTVGGFFIRQLQELMGLINSTNPHWIRCIKPHPARQPRMFSHLSVMTQLRSAGVLDTVKVRKAGYPIRFKKDLFLQRYRILLLPGDHDVSSDERCKNIFKRLEINIEAGQLGKTKVFLRQIAFSKLNHAKDEATHVFSLLFQAVGRASKEREVLFKQFVLVHRARIMAERKAKEEALRRQRLEEERLRKEAEERQLLIERAEAERKKKAVVTIQRYWRGYSARDAMARYVIEELRAKEEKRCDDEYQKMRTTFDDIDRRVKIVEKRYAELQKMRSQGAANEDMYTMSNKRRTALNEKRDARFKAMEDAEKQKEALRERELKAERSKRLRAVEEKKMLRREEERKLAEKRRSAQLARETAEEQLAERLEQKEAAMLTKRQRLASQRAVAEAIFVEKVLSGGVAEDSSDSPHKHLSRRQQHRHDDPHWVADAKRDWEGREAWEENREDRFRYLEQTRSTMTRSERSKASLIQSKMYSYVPNVSLNNHNNTRGMIGLQREEMRRENEFRREILRSAQQRAVASQLLHSSASPHAGFSSPTQQQQQQQQQHYGSPSSSSPFR